MCSRGRELGESAFMATQGKNKNHAKQKGKDQVPPQAKINKESKCFFCKKKGHMMKDCVKFQKWLEKKGYTKLKEAIGK